MAETLGMRTGLDVMTPAHINYEGEPPYRVVYLLHGLSDNHTCWRDNTQLARFADEYHVIFICPEVQRSFYADMKHGPKYFTYITEELPQICQRLFHIPADREHTFVMGLSMGGYGALKCALTKPEQYAGCGAFSAACDLEQALQTPLLMNKEEIQGITGMEMRIAPENDVFLLAKKCSQSPVKPRIYMTCGTEDHIHDMSVKFRDYMQKLDFDYTYEEWQGAHDWYFWNDSLRRALAHLLPDLQK